MPYTLTVNDHPAATVQFDTIGEICDQAHTLAVELASADLVRMTITDPDDLPYPFVYSCDPDHYGEAGVGQAVNELIFKIRSTLHHDADKAAAQRRAARRQ